MMKNKNRIKPIAKVICIWIAIGIVGYFVSWLFKIEPCIEFVCIIDPGGSGDYLSLNAWEAAIQNDLTKTTVKVFSHNGIIRCLYDGDYVVGSLSEAIGINVHTTSTQIMIKNISGKFESGERIHEAETKDWNYVEISNEGDPVIAVAECRITNGYADTTPVNIDGWTTDERNYIKITAQQEVSIEN